MLIIQVKVKLVTKHIADNLKSKQFSYLHKQINYYKNVFNDKMNLYTTMKHC